ncbi:hypothetical protein GJ703_02964 [Clostridium botulinum]|nr:hypothetical protein RSJ9_3527 [Clostridium botulinum]APQ97217.1 hypothetical protein RSJ3_794 [Clostridium botulinum]QGT44686.1 hypothetical protein GJ703_02964 [Clostridium botulinum]RUT54879.1 hypothetical protein NPD9_436 [Clostridium botulinum]
MEIILKNTKKESLKSGEEEHKELKIIFVY